MCGHLQLSDVGHSSMIHGRCFRSICHFSFFHLQNKINKYQIKNGETLLLWGAVEQKRAWRWCVSSGENIITLPHFYHSEHEAPLKHISHALVCICLCVFNACNSLGKHSQVNFGVNYLVLALGGEISDFGEWYYYFWHRGSDASFPTTTDETANGKIMNSIWRQNKHTHTCAHGLIVHLIPSVSDQTWCYEMYSWATTPSAGVQTCFLSLPDSGHTHTHVSVHSVYSTSNNRESNKGALNKTLHVRRWY